MKFILDLWPDVEGDDPQALLRYAIESITINPDLVWEIQNDDGSTLADNVKQGA